MLRKTLLTAALVGLGWIGSLAGEASVPLTASNRTPYERAELAAGGVPLPMGLAADAKRLRILDAGGAAVPAQFTVLNRWPADKSIRWVLVQFPVKLAGDATAKFTLRTGQDAPMPEPKRTLKIAETKNRVTVDTGALRFSVRTDRFALFDEVDLLAEGGKSRRLAGPQACGPGFAVKTADGGTFEMGGEGECRVTVEDAGPLRATILAEGRHRDEDGKSLFDYQVRMYAAAGSRAVRVQYVFTRSGGEWPAELTDLKQVFVRFTPALERNISRWVTDPNGRRAEAKEPLRLASLISPGGEGERQRFYEGPAAIAVRDAAGAGLAASVRWFWQLRPKSMEAAANGSVTIRLIDARGEGIEPVHFYPGMSKTHDLLFHFTGPGESFDTEHAAAAFQDSLFVKCPPEWYCQKTLSLGRLVSADYGGYLPELREVRGKIDESIADQIKFIRDARRRLFDRKRDVDSYTAVHFGDGFHHFFGSDHRQVQWDNCYYSYTHLLAMQYARTGDDLYLDTLREAATFEGDIAVVWHERHRGAPRVNPGAYHIGGFSGWKRFNSSTWNFYKPIGMLELFYLTGDRRHQEAGLTNARWMLRHNGYNMLNNPRSCGSGLRAAAHGYLATGDEGFLQVGRRTAISAVGMQRTFGHFAPVRNSVFMVPNALEGLCVYHELTGDEVLTEKLPEMVRAHYQRFGRGPGSLNYAYMNLYVAALTGDDALRKEILDGLAARGGGINVRRGEHAIKDFSLGNRGVPLAMWYLSDLAAKPTPWAGRTDLGKPPLTRVDCPRLATPKLDGKAGEAEWKVAAELSLVYDPDPGRNLAAPTKVRIGHDLENLYILVLAEEPRMGEVQVEVEEEGGPVYRDDCVEIYVSPVPRRYGLKLIVNAAGVKATRARGFERKKYTPPAPGDISAAAGRWEKGWLLEVAVPLAKLGLKVEPKAGTELGFNCVRFRKPAQAENSTWIGAVNEMASTGTVVLE